MRARPSVPMVTELYWPTLPALCRVVRVAAVQAALEQRESLGSGMGAALEVRRPRPSVPMVTELYWPTLSARCTVVRVAAVQAESEQWATLRSALVAS